MPDAVTLAALRPAAQIALRGDGGDPAFRAAVENAAGLVLPVEPNMAASSGGRSLLWLGPTEWLLVADDTPAAVLLPDLAAALAGLHAAVVDQTAARALRLLSGPGSRDLLARGCAIDLHPRRFGPGRVAQTLLARTHVLLHQTDEAPSFRLYVRPSYAAYLDIWLRTAAPIANC